MIKLVKQQSPIIYPHGTPCLVVRGLEIESLTTRFVSCRTQQDNAESETFWSYSFTMLVAFDGPFWDQYQYLGNCPPTPSLTQH